MSTGRGTCRARRAPGQCRSGQNSRSGRCCCTRRRRHSRCSVGWPAKTRRIARPRYRVRSSLRHHRTESLRCNRRATHRLRYPPTRHLRQAALRLLHLRATLHPLPRRPHSLGAGHCEESEPPGHRKRGGHNPLCTGGLPRRPEGPRSARAAHVIAVAQPRFGLRRLSPPRRCGRVRLTSA